MKSKKLLATSLSVATIACSAVAFTGCDLLDRVERVVVSTIDGIVSSEEYEVVRDASFILGETYTEDYVVENNNVYVFVNCKFEANVTINENSNVKFWGCEFNGKVISQSAKTLEMYNCKVLSEQEKSVELKDCTYSSRVLIEKCEFNVEKGKAILATSTIDNFNFSKVVDIKDSKYKEVEEEIQEEEEEEGSSANL